MKAIAKMSREEMRAEVIGEARGRVGMSYKRAVRYWTSLSRNQTDLIKLWRAHKKCMKQENG